MNTTSVPIRRLFHSGVLFNMASVRTAVSSIRIKVLSTEREVSIRFVPNSITRAKNKGGHKFVAYNCCAAANVPPPTHEQLKILRQCRSPVKHQSDPYKLRQN